MNNDGYKDYIIISIIQDKGFVFSVDDIKRLRERYKILGILSGTLAVAPQQSNFLSVPLQLSLEEITYLELFHGSRVRSNSSTDNKDVVKLSDDSFILEQLTDGFFNTQEKEAYLNTIYQEFEDEISLKKQQILETRRKYESEMKNKTIKNNESTDKKNELIRYGISDKDLNLIFYKIPNNSFSLPNYDLVFEYALKNEKMKQKEMLIKLILANTSEKNYNNDSKFCNFLKKLEMSTKFLGYALRDTENYYISPGMKFGGKFIMYPGDPLRYHSHYIINFYNYQNDPINLLRIVGGGRLAVGVKKVWVLSGIKNQIDTRSYIHENDEESKLQEGNEVSLSQKRHDQVESFLAHLQQEDQENQEDQIMNFSVEWAGFG